MNILDFCDKTSRLKQFAEVPFNFQGKTVATNGLIVVYVNPCLSKYGESEHQTPEKELTRLYRSVNQFSGRFKPLPDFDKTMETPTCSYCYGQGMTHSRGIGLLTCPYCHGTGIVYPIFRVVGICVRYDLMLNLSSIKDCTIASDKDGKLLFFKNKEGVSGVCVGLNAQNCRAIIDI